MEVTLQAPGSDEQLFDPGESSPASLPYPVTFVNPNMARWPALTCTDPIPSLAEAHKHLSEKGGCYGRDNLTWNTYLALKHRGHNVCMGTTFPESGLCITHYDYIKRKFRNAFLSSFLVVIRADRPNPVFCDHQIVQNPRLADMCNSHFIPCWPQPGLIPRRETRGSRIANCVFLGDKENLSAEFHSNAFRRQLQAFNVELILRTNPMDWINYADVDLILAVRSARHDFLLTKPASKLVNSWRARVPALLGPEPAFEDLRESELDYFRIHTPAQVIEAIQQLRGDKDLYAQMVENGQRRAREFTFAAVARAWEQLLSGDVARAYERFIHSPRIFSIPSKIARFSGRYGYYKIWRKMFGLKY